MRIFIRGTDKGNAVLSALIFIMLISMLFISLAPRILAINQYANKYKAKIIYAIEQTNRELMNHYDLY